MEKLISEIREKLRIAVKKEQAEALLFSGGLDSSVLASLSSLRGETPDVNPGMKTRSGWRPVGAYQLEPRVLTRGAPSKIRLITVTLDSYGRDLYYAKRCTDYLGLNLYHKKIHIEEAIEFLPTVIKILNTFDPAIPNDITVYFGLRFAKELGIASVMTGDGSDELLAGYDYMQDIDKLDEYIKKISKDMYFSSNNIGSSLGVKIIQPYMDKDFKDFCLGIDTNFKIRRENGKVWGKWILRKAFSDSLPNDIIWQDKRPLEYGSGTNELRKVFSDKISESEFEEKKNRYPIRFINKEHLYYYEIYKKIIGDIPKVRPGEKSCPGCGTGIKKDSYHCRLCGWVVEIVD